MKTPATPPEYVPLLQTILKDKNKLLVFPKVLAEHSSGPYYHWEKIRFRKPIPPLSAKEMWAVIKFIRAGVRREVPVVDKKGHQFHYIQRGSFQRALHEIDSNARGLIAVPGIAATADSRDAYLQKSLVEEPFSSSVLEGAATTREIARKMIEEGRKPKTIDERMVLNNYRAMSFIREHWNEPLTLARILEVHRILTEGTFFERPEMVGVLRGPHDDVRVVDSVSGETLHTPPPADQLPKRLEQICEFANAPSLETDEFLHPVIRAIILHFMIGYDHPFWDGNGRCARALFYWCVLKHGYWLLEYVSISSIIRKAPVQYGMAYLNVETDDSDLTYFIENQLDVIEKSITELQTHLVGKARELNILSRAMGKLEGQLNRRQLIVIQRALKQPVTKYTISEHEKLHGVSYLTARSDLERLTRLGFLQKGKLGTKSIFSTPKNLKEILERRAAA